MSRCDGWRWLSSRDLSETPGVIREGMLKNARLDRLVWGEFFASGQNEISGHSQGERMSEDITHLIKTKKNGGGANSIKSLLLRQFIHPQKKN